jgi:hypothetical protein
VALRSGLAALITVASSSCQMPPRQATRETALLEIVAGGVVVLGQRLASPADGGLANWMDGAALIAKSLKSVPDVEKGIPLVIVEPTTPYGDLVWIVRSLLPVGLKHVRLSCSKNGSGVSLFSGDTLSDLPSRNQCETPLPTGCPQFLLTLGVSGDGFQLAANGALFGPASESKTVSVPRVHGVLDFAALGITLGRVKAAHPEEVEVVFVADDVAPAEIACKTLEVTHPLFPEFVLGNL